MHVKTLCSGKIRYTQVLLSIQWNKQKKIPRPIQKMKSVTQINKGY